LFLKQDKLTTLRTKSSYGLLGGIAFSRLKIFARSLRRWSTMRPDWNWSRVNSSY